MTNKGEPKMSDDFDINSEKAIMGPVVEQWRARASHFNMKPGSAKYSAQSEAFFEGALKVMVVTGRMSSERHGIIAFMCSVGRMEEMLKLWEGV